MSVVTIHVDRSGRVTGQIVRLDTGAGFQPDELYFSLWDVESGQIINSRDNVQLTPIASYVDASGNLTHSLTRSDMVLYDSTKKTELHRLRYYWIYNSDADAGDAVVDFEVAPDPAP